MKLLLNERRKHQLIGAIVLIALVALFLPATMKTSIDRLDENIHVSVNLPKKPSLPNVTQSQEKKSFKTIKVAHIDVSNSIEERQLMPDVKAIPLSQASSITLREDTTIRPDKALETPVKVNHLTKTIDVQKQPALKKQLTAKLSHPVLAKNKNAPIYSVQLGSFALRQNAISLVTRLRKKGFQASLVKSQNPKKELYKVLVGQVSKRQEAINLQKQLAEDTHLTGFIIKSGVS